MRLPSLPKAAEPPYARPVSRFLLSTLRKSVAGVALTGFVLAFSGLPGHLSAHLGAALASSQFVPSAVSLATGAAVSLGCLVILGLTLLFGRVYCGALCPLGLLQDLFRRLGRRMSLAPRFLKYAPAHTLLRTSILVAVLGLLFTTWGMLTVSALDPYSNFGRIISVLLRPPLQWIAQSLHPGLSQHPHTALSQAEVAWAPIGVITAVTLFLAGVATMSTVRGRLYCNTLCPVGTLLGWVSRRSLYRLRIQSERCQKCAECLHVCRAQCIDLRSQKIDASRCVACFDCLSVCDHGALAYDRPRRKPVNDEEAASLAEPNPNFRAGRRAFLGTSAAALLLAGTGLERKQHERRREQSPFDDDLLPQGISPPGSRSVAEFLSRCTACQLCVSACPTGALQPSLSEYGWAGILKPRMDPNVAGCHYDCHLCGHVCPTGAISHLALAEKQVTQIGVVRLNRHHCIPHTKREECGKCAEVCPTGAMYLIVNRRGLKVPRIDTALCNGCGLCQAVCPAEPRKALRVVPNDVHARAEPRRDRSKERPESPEDFS